MKCSYQFTDEAEQLALDVDVEGWTPHNLVLWLDRQLRQPDIHHKVHSRPQAARSHRCGSRRRTQYRLSTLSVRT